MKIENSALFLPLKSINDKIYQQILKLFINLAELKHIKKKLWDLYKNLKHLLSKEMW